MAFKSQKIENESLEKECCYYCTITDSQLIIPSEPEHVGSYHYFVFTIRVYYFFPVRNSMSQVSVPGFTLLIQTY